MRWWAPSRGGALTASSSLLARSGSGRRVGCEGLVSARCRAVDVTNVKLLRSYTSWPAACHFTFSRAAALSGRRAQLQAGAVGVGELEKAALDAPGDGAVERGDHCFLQGVEVARAGHPRH